MAVFRFRGGKKMIKLNRDTIPVPPELNGPQSKGAQEKTLAIQHYRNFSAVTHESYVFKIYQSEGVKAALSKTSQGKCAYCESKYESTGNMHVEHYRPKHGIIINNRLVRPGYYWLASDWDNLLPSCLKCNTRNKEDVNGEIRVVGKGNYFPLADETKRAQCIGGENAEEPLLLNPFIHNPEEHLIFTEDGIVIPRQSAGEQNLLADESIKTYGLQRNPLVQARRDRIKIVLGIIKNIHISYKQLSTSEDPDELLNHIRSEMEWLEELQADAGEYAGAIRQVVNRHFERLFKIRKIIRGLNR